MSNKETVRALNFFLTIILGTVGGVGVYMMTADPRAKLPACFIFAILTVVLGMQAVIK